MSEEIKNFFHKQAKVIWGHTLNFELKKILNFKFWKKKLIHCLQVSEDIKDFF